MRFRTTALLALVSAPFAHPRHLNSRAALLDYPPRSQSWYQVEWTLGSAAITTSVLVNDPTLDSAQLHRVIAWLDAVSRKDLTFERPEDMNNHHYWRALAATGVVGSGNTLFC